MKHFLLGGALGALAGFSLAAGILYPAPAPAPADTASWVQPYGGCKEAADYPDSVGAKECKAHGY